LLLFSNLTLQKTTIRRPLVLAAVWKWIISHPCLFRAQW